LDGSTPNATVESNLTFDGSILNVSGRIIASASSTDDLVRITQTGTGNSFLVEDSTNPDSTSFVIDNAGNVGMGTLTPQTVLHIKSNPSSTQTAIIRLESDAYTANSSIAYYSGGVNRWEVGTGIALGALYEIYDRVVGQTRFSITTGGATAFLNGNVGVGTPSPSYSVHILGTMSTTNFIMTNGATNGYVLTSDASGNATWQPGGATITNFGNNRIVTSDGTTTGLVGETNMTFDGSTLVVTATNSTTATLIIASGSTTSDLVRITQTGTGNALVVEDSTNSDSTPFVITNTGNVGIGVTATSNKFEVSGNMKLSGTFSGSNNNYVSADAITQTVLLFLSNNC